MEQSFVLENCFSSNDEIALILCSRNFPSIAIDDEHKKVFVEFFLSVLAAGAGADVFFDLIFLMTLHRTDRRE